MTTTGIVILSVALFILVFGILPVMVLSYVIFTVLLVRNKPEKWGHGCSQPDDGEVVAMYNEALLWREKYESNRREAWIENDRIKLYGEFFDFGSDKTAIILAGRMESCVYSSYFGEPYRRAGYNVMVVDNRAHGFSGGKYNTVGYREYRDIIKWGEWLHSETNTKSIVLHGICIGACTSMFAITSDNCPDYFTGIVVEGMYSTFYSSVKNHMKADNRPIFPFFYMLIFYTRVLMGINVVTDGPQKRLKKLTRPILFIHGEKDLFSLPENARKMYAECPSDKRIVWFERGKHSRLRINNLEAYDAAILDFLPTLGQQNSVETD